MSRRLCLRAGIAALCLPGATQAATSRFGVSDGEVVFGQNAVLSGDYGTPVRGLTDGIQAAFDAANAAGGIAGRKLRLVSLDDRFSPELATRNCRELLFGSDPALALIGCVGSATAMAAARVAEEAGALMLGVIGVGDAARDQLSSVAFFVRTSTARECEYIARHLSTIGMTRVSTAVVDTPGGTDVARQLETALQARQVSVTTGVRLKVDGSNTAEAAAALAKAQPQAVLMWLVAPIAARLMQEIDRLGTRPWFVGLSIVAGEQVARQLAAKVRGLATLQVVPYPWGDRSSLRPYQQALRGRTGIGHLSLEGWICGQLAVHALQQCGRDLTRERFAAALRSTRREIAGLELDFSGSQNTGSRYVELLAVRPDGSFVR